MCSNKIVFCWTPLQNQRWMGPLSWSSASSSSDVGCWTLRSLSLSFWLARSLARSRTFSFVSCKTQEILPSFLVFWIFWISRVLPFIFHSSRPLPPVKKEEKKKKKKMTSNATMKNKPSTILFSSFSSPSSLVFFLIVAFCSLSKFANGFYLPGVAPQGKSSSYTNHRFFFFFFFFFSLSFDTVIDTSEKQRLTMHRIKHH